MPRTVSFEQVDRAVTTGASHFDRKDAVQAVAESFREGAPAAEVERLADEFLASEAVISLGERKQAELTERHLEAAKGWCDRLEDGPWRQRRAELPRARKIEAAARRDLEAQRAQQQAMVPVRVDARRELAAIDKTLAERHQLAVSAARISPPAYITNELGERPREPELRKEWDCGVGQIERYRHEHGVTNKEHAFGKSEPKDHIQRIERETAQEQLRTAQRRLGLEQGRESSRDLSKQIERGTEIGL